MLAARRHSISVNVEQCFRSLTRISVEGRWDTTGDDLISVKLLANCRSARSVILDLSGVTGMGAPSVNTLVQCIRLNRCTNGRLVVVCPTCETRDTLMRFGVHHDIILAHSFAEAVAAFGIRMPINDNYP